MHSRRMCVLAILVTFVLLASAVMPIPVFAQDPLPPPPDEGVTQDITPIEPSAEGEAPPDAPTLEDSPPVDELTLPEVLDAAPEGTEVVVLDENGDPLPLTSDAAAEVLLTGDPIWCPEGASPGDSDCTSAHLSFADLLLDLDTNGGTFNGNGTIFVAFDYATPLADASGIVIDFLDLDLSNLTIQGGWNGLTGVDFGLSGTSTISTWLDIQDWGSGDSGVLLTINDLIFNDGGGLYVYDDGGTTTADVTLNNVGVYGSYSDGAYIETTGNVEVNDSEFKRNDYDGLEVYADGNITLNDVTATANDEYGVEGWAEGSFVVDGGTFSRNTYSGLFVGAEGNVTIEDVTAKENGEFGILSGAMGDMTLNDILVDDNDWGGILAGALGNASAAGVTANDNGYVGVVLGAIGNASLSDVIARRNGVLGAGVIALGDASLSNVLASYNGGIGAAALALGNASLTDVRTNGNTYVGTAALAFGNVSLEHVIANENGFAGVAAVSLGGLPIVPLLFDDGGPLSGYDLSEIPYVGPALDEIDWYEATMTPGTVSLNNVTANDNGMIGGVAAAVGDVSVNNSVFNENSLAGALAIAGGNVFVGHSTFNGNGALGLGAGSLLEGNVTALYITAAGNDGPGVVLGSGALELMPMFPFVSGIEPSLTAEVLLACSSVTDNAGPGLGALSNTTISGNDLTGNSSPHEEMFGAVVTDVGSTECGAAEAMLGEYLTRLKAAKKEEAGGACGDWTQQESDVTATFHELCGHDATLEPPALPGALPAGVTQVALATVAGDLPQPDGWVTLSFSVPSGGDPASLSVMFWDGSQWVDVPGANVAGGKLEVTVKEAGTYVLAQ